MIIIVFEILSSFFLKAVDNGLSTFKTIYLQKEDYIKGGLYNALSTFFYLVGVVQITKSNSIFNIIAMCIATFLGTYLPGLFLKRSERDKLYIFDVTADNLNLGKDFADAIREENIAIKTFSSYDTYMNKVLTCKVYCTTKDESRIVNKLMPKTFKYNIYSPLYSE